MASCLRFQKKGSALVCLNGTIPLLYLYENGNVLVPSDTETGFVRGAVSKMLIQLGVIPDYIKYGEIIYGLNSAIRLWNAFNHSEINSKPSPHINDDFENKCIVCLAASRDAILECGHATMCKACHYWWLLDNAHKKKTLPQCNLCCAIINEKCSKAICTRPWSHEMVCGCKLCPICVIRSWKTNSTLNCQCCCKPTYAKVTRHVIKPKTF